MMHLHLHPSHTERERARGVRATSYKLREWARSARERGSIMVTPRRGVTMIELMVALAIVSVGVFGLAGGATLVTRLMGGGTVQQRASTIANAHIEQFRSLSCGSITNGGDTVRNVISTWTKSDITVSGNRRGMGINLTVQYPTTKGMRSQVYRTILPC